MLFDFLGSLLSLLSTYFFIQLDKRAWIIGIFATFLNGWLYWSKGIYADACLESLYSVSMIYGWCKWQKPQTTIPHERQLRSYSSIQWGLLVLLFSIICSVLYFFLLHAAHSKVPLLDAITTSLSLLAQWLMCHKLIITWVIWFIADAIFALMYFNKGLPVHSFLMIIYTCLAVFGYWRWSNISLRLKQGINYSMNSKIS